MAAPRRSSAGKSVMSRGTRVACAPEARATSSTSSSPPTVRASRMSSAPSAANRLAMAAPSPREAPVTSATRPARRPGAMRSGGFGEERELSGGADALIRETGRIVAREAGVTELRLARIAPRPPHGAIEPIDGNEGEAVDPDDFGHGLH